MRVDLDEFERLANECTYSEYKSILAKLPALIADLRAVRDMLDKLPGAVMNLPIPHAKFCESVKSINLSVKDPDVFNAYGIGHRDARHAMAELIETALAAHRKGDQP